MHNFKFALNFLRSFEILLSIVIFFLAMSTPAPKRKRQQISVEVKKQIIDASATKSYGQLATDFKLPKSTISTIVKDKEKTLAAIDGGFDAKRKRLTTGRNEDLEASVLTWFQQVRSQNVAISGPLLKVNLNVFSNSTLYSRKKRWNWQKSLKLKALRRAIVG